MKTGATVNDIAKLMESIAPLSLAESWDNVGLMLGHRSKPVRRLLLALDLSPEVAQQAIEQQADMVITHHPAIFAKLGCLTSDNWQQELLLRLAERGVAVYSAHTNLDCASGGVNDVLAKRLRLQDVEVLDEETGLGRIGVVEACELEGFAGFVKQALRAPYVVYGGGKRPVRKVAVCGGAGSDLIELALALGADTLVTGDVKYHSAQQAVFSGLNIIDAGHQFTERPVLDNLADRLSLLLSEKEWDVSITVAKETALLTGI